MITLQSDYSDLDAELDRLERLPDFKLKRQLDNVLDHGFKKTQAEVHIITGSLKSSGKKTSDIQGDEWVGEIRYGGPSKGINNPVDYAIYEKARDAEHDFFAGLPLLHLEYVAVIKKGLSG